MAVQGLIDSEAASNSNVGLGIRPELFEWALASSPKVDYFEAHSENYFGHSIARLKLLELREDYPISMHGVGLSLGRADQLNQAHLHKLSELVSAIDPLFVSEHLAWSAYSHRHVPDLLPLPLVKESLQVVCEHVSQMQDVIKRQILIENPSNYAVFDVLQIPEAEFLNEVASRTGCGLLVDINNVEVSAHNTAREASEYVMALKGEFIQQYHLAGFTKVEREGQPLYIDTHNQPVHDEVWALYQLALSVHGHRPTLIEWDSDYPEPAVLLQQCERARELNQVELESEDADPFRQEIVHSKSTDKVLANPYLSHSPKFSLNDFQTVFMDNLLQDSAPLPHAAADYSGRMAVYQNNTRSAILDYLRDVFPAVQGVVGEQYFSQLGLEYLHHQPPTEGDINLYGEAFAKYLTSLETVTGLVYLADLARFEWAIHRAYFAKIGDVLDPSEYTHESLLGQAVEFNHSVSVLHSQYPIAEIHRQSLPGYTGKVGVSLDQSSDTILVYKQQHAVETRVLALGEAALLSELQGANNLLQAINVLSGSLEQADLSASLAMVIELGLLQAEAE